MALTNKNTAKAPKAAGMDAAEVKMNKILQLRAEELATIKGLIETAKAEAKQAEYELDRATMAGDTDGYSAAKTKWRGAQDAAEMHEKRVKALETKPLISEDERAELSKKIKGDVAQAVNSNTAELLKIGARLREIQQTEYELVTRANSLLDTLQYDIMLQPRTAQADHYGGPETWRKLGNGVLRGNDDLFGPLNS